MNAKGLKTDGLDEIVHLSTEQQLELVTLCDKAVRQTLASLRESLTSTIDALGPPVCAECVQRAMAIALAQVMCAYAGQAITELDGIEQFVDLVMRQLAAKFLAARLARAQAQTTTPGAPVH